MRISCDLVRVIKLFSYKSKWRQFGTIHDTAICRNSHHESFYFSNVFRNHEILYFTNAFLIKETHI